MNKIVLIIQREFIELRISLVLHVLYIFNDIIHIRDIFQLSTSFIIIHKFILDYHDHGFPKTFNQGLITSSKSIYDTFNLITNYNLHFDDFRFSWSHSHPVIMTYVFRASSDSFVHRFSSHVLDLFLHILDDSARKYLGWSIVHNRLGCRFDELEFFYIQPKTCIYSPTFFKLKLEIFRGHV